MNILLPSLETQTISELAIENADLRKELAESQAECVNLRNKQFRIMGAGSVPWRLVAPYEDQAKENHSQTLDELNKRGGLDPSEVWCIVHGKRWRDRISRDLIDAWFVQWRTHDIEAKLTACEAKIERLVSALAKQTRHALEALRVLNAPETSIEIVQKIGDTL